MQLLHMAELCRELYPSTRLHLYDLTHRFSAPVTVFGQQRAVIYTGSAYFVFNTREHIETLTRHFDELVRDATVLSHEVSAWLEKGTQILFRGAPHLLITSAPADAPCPVQDTHIALTTFQLLAHAHGIGTVWDGICMMALGVCPEVVGKLGIPENHTLGYAIAFGEPAVEYQRTVQRGPALVNVVKW